MVTCRTCKQKLIKANRLVYCVNHNCSEFRKLEDKRYKDPYVRTDRDYEPYYEK